MFVVIHRLCKRARDYEFLDAYIKSFRKALIRNRIINKQIRVKQRWKIYWAKFIEYCGFRL